MWHFQKGSHLASYPYDQNITKEKCQTISSVALLAPSGALVAIPTYY